MRIHAATALVFGLLSAHPLLASEAICKDDDAALEARVAACTALIDAGEGVEAWMYRERADAYDTADQDDAELEALNIGLMAFPDDDGLLADRAYLLRDIGRLDEALADTTRLIEIEPEDHWNWFMHAWTLETIDAEGGQAEILAAYDRAIEARDDYYFSRFWRGQLLVKMERPADAVPDFEAAASIRPFNENVYTRLGDAYRDAGDSAGAVRAWGIAAAIEPDYRTALEERINAAIDPEVAPAPDRIDRKPRTEPLKIRYVLDLLPVDTMSEMERSIMAIASWFSPAPDIEPEALAFITREFLPGDDEIEVKQEMEASEGFDEKLGIVGLTYRGLVPLRITPPVPGAPTLEYIHAAPGLEALWPLEVGKELVGSGVIELPCPPEKPSMFELLSGCRVGMERTQAATFEYGMFVLRKEVVTVPLGRFDTIVIRYRDLSTITMGGVTQSRQIEQHWWFAPELGAYVQATGEQNGKILTYRATEILSDGT